MENAIKMQMRAFGSCTRSFVVFGLLIATDVPVTGQDINNSTGSATNVTIANFLEATDTSLILDALLELTGLDELIASRDLELTVFAPTDDAFRAVPCRFSEDIEFLPHLTSILLYHVIEGRVLSSELEIGDEVVALNGETLKIQSLDPVVIVNESMVVVADTETINGVVHIIDQVLLPSAATSSVADLVTSNPTLSTLNSAVVFAKLSTALANFESIYTLFAPSNRAFEKLPPGILDSLLLTENVGTLIEILLFHVLKDEVLTFADLVAGGIFGSQKLNVTSLNVTKINEMAVIVETNRLANNGIVHIIDTVLIPPSVDVNALLSFSSVGTDDKPLRLECQFDCDFDTDCAPGLLCADEHKQELAEKGLDPRKAYCQDSFPGSGFTEDDRLYGEVCFDPELV